MSRVVAAGLILLGLLGLVACAGNDGASSDVPAVEGPALLFFYTDN